MLTQILQRLNDKYHDDQRGYPCLHIFADGSGYVSAGSTLFFSFKTVEELVEKLY